MTNELKTRAKRLRTAIKDTLDVSISVAHSLELVAKEENYPNWDAATAAFSKRLKLSKKNCVSVPKEPEVIYFQGLHRSMLDSRDDQRSFLSRFSGADRIVLIGGDSETQAWLLEYGYITDVVPVGTIPPEGARSFVLEPKTVPVTHSSEGPLEIRQLERMKPVLSDTTPEAEAARLQLRAATQDIMSTSITPITQFGLKLNELQADDPVEYEVPFVPQRFVMRDVLSPEGQLRAQEAYRNANGIGLATVNAETTLPAVALERGCFVSLMPIVDRLVSIQPTEKKPAKDIATMPFYRKFERK